MTDPAIIRPVRATDMAGLKSVIAAVDLFPSEMLDGMAEAYLSGAASEEIWLTVEGDGLAAIAYCAPERMTSGTWNLLLIAVHPSRQGMGIGAAITQHLEKMLAEQGDRILLVETSSLPEFARTRSFYLKTDYHEEARIRDYYQAGEDKVIFRKVLSTPA